MRLPGILCSLALAKKKKDTLTESGPKGCHFSNSPSGWFDHQLFSDWLEKLMIPRLKKMEGKNMLIVDNLASRLSIDTLKLCRDNNIALRPHLQPIKSSMEKNSD